MPLALSSHEPSGKVYGSGGEQEAAQWMKSQQLRAYIDAVERVATSERSQVSPEKLQQWLGWARAVADRVDPLKALT